jgi:glucose/arabinose dehydrogenase
MLKRCIWLALGAAIGLGSGTAVAADRGKLLEQIKLPPGFKISVFAEVPGARSIAICKPLNTIYVGSRQGPLHAVRDKDRDGTAEEVIQKADDLNVPNGVACQDSLLYVALQDKVVVWDVPAEFDMAIPFAPLLKTLKEGLPNEFLHGWRYAKFGPDRKLYVSIGAPCNICAVDGLKGTIIRMDPDGSDVEVVATGVRNSVGFDWHPVTGELYFTDNGADGMGDDVPPDELNRVTEIGKFYGFPYFGGKGVRLTGFEEKSPPETPVPPALELAPHAANLGIHFYRGKQFPDEYKNSAFIAQHGSWNRTVPDGYRIVRVTFDDKGNPTGSEPFAEGWLTDAGADGRPVDIAELPDGSLIVSDDYANLIYRISYEK